MLESREKHHVRASSFVALLVVKRGVSGCGKPSRPGHIRIRVSWIGEFEDLVNVHTRLGGGS